MEKKIRIAISDDHPMVLEGLSLFFKDNRDIEVVATTQKVSETPKMVSIHRPDILLMDYHFTNEGQTGLDMCGFIKTDFPFVKVIIISSFADVSIIKRCIEAGASGYLLKTAGKQEYIDAIRNVYIGGDSFGTQVRDLLVKDRLAGNAISNIRFTNTEKSILKLIIEGCSTDEIARTVCREKSTIDSHRKSILSKLQSMDNESTTPSKNILFYVTKYNIASRIDSL